MVFNYTTVHLLISYNKKRVNEKKVDKQQQNNSGVKKKFAKKYVKLKNVCWFFQTDQMWSSLLSNAKSRSLFKSMKPSHDQDFLSLVMKPGLYP